MLAWVWRVMNRYQKEVYGCYSGLLALHRENESTPLPTRSMERTHECNHSIEWGWFAYDSKNSRCCPQKEHPLHLLRSSECPRREEEVQLHHNGPVQDLLRFVLRLQCSSWSGYRVDSNNSLLHHWWRCHSIEWVKGDGLRTRDFGGGLQEVHSSDFQWKGHSTCSSLPLCSGIPPEMQRDRRLQGGVDDEWMSKEQVERDPWDQSGTDQGWCSWIGHQERTCSQNRLDQM